MTPRSWLYCPGNAPGRIVNAHIYGADGIVLDLEDSVDPLHKDEARFLVTEALKDFFPALAGDGSVPVPVVAVRINGMETPWWRRDVESVVAAGGSMIRVPKVERAEAISALDSLLTDLERRLGRTEAPVQLQCILETPRGIEAAYSVAGASERIRSLCFGAEDYCAATGIDRRGPDWVLDYPRSRIVAAAASAGLPAYDTVWGDFRDEEGLRRDGTRARALGMVGKAVIHPDQIETVNALFSPTDDQVAWARSILDRAGDSTGAASADGTMVDAPVIAQARRILSRVQGGRNQ